MITRLLAKWCAAALSPGVSPPKAVFQLDYRGGVRVNPENQKLEPSPIRCGWGLLGMRQFTSDQRSFTLQCECGASRSQGVCVISRPQHSSIPTFHSSNLAQRSHLTSEFSAYSPKLNRALAVTSQ